MMMTGAFSWNVGKVISELKLVTDNLSNLLSIYAAANWEATGRKSWYSQCTSYCWFQLSMNTEVVHSKDFIDFHKWIR